MNMHQPSFSPNDCLSTTETYSEHRSCNYFIGSTGQITITETRKGIVVFSNPKASSVNVIMEHICSSNLSGTPLSLEVFYSTKISGNVTLSSQIIQGSKACATQALAKSKIYYGNGNVTSSTKKILTKTIPAYKTCQETMATAITLSPGTNHVFLFSPLVPQATAAICMSFTWWEEAIQG